MRISWNRVLLLVRSRNMDHTIPGYPRPLLSNMDKTVDFRKREYSGDIIDAVPFHGQQILDPVPVIALQLDGISFDSSTACKLSFHEFREIFKVDISRIEALDHRYFLTVAAFVDLDIDPLLFFCYLLTDTKFLG